MSFENLGLAPELLRAIHSQDYNEPTPVQQAAIPPVLAGRDLIARAQTGTGKTAAFTLPLLQRLAANKPQGGRRPRALILAPTRELAAQVAESVRTYGEHLPLRSCVIFGGVSINPQISALRRGVDIIIATPGRLLDHLQQRTVDLRAIETLVLDEADRMLDMGFIRDIRKVLAVLPSNRQTLLFSATFSAEIEKLAGEILREPERVAVAPRNSAAQTVEQVIHPVDRANKRQLLSYLIGSGRWAQVLVFTRTKHGANRLATQLEQDGIRCAAIHGNKSQGARTRALDDFKRGAVRVLVATDIAARGLDIDQLAHVVNYELPNVPEDYVHRIGRTGRAGHEGQAISLLGEDEHGYMRDIEKLLGRSLPRVPVEGFEPTPGLRAPPPTSGQGRSGRPGPGGRGAAAGRGRPGQPPRKAQRRAPRRFAPPAS
ncbi:MAG: DEAD/DEAH box helicase [Chromatiales bacterium]|nr:DEAD/DEAH box helicase [Chromatiales bacterium]